MSQERDIIIEDIFSQAHKFDGLEYIYTLLRAEGMVIDDSDRLLKLKLRLQQEIEPLDEDLHNEFMVLLNDDVFQLIANLLRLIRGSRYSVVPFFKVKKGLSREPSPLDKVYFIVRQASESGKVNFAELLKTAYQTKTISKLLSQEKIEVPKLREAYNSCRTFTNLLLNIYNEQRLNYRGHIQFTKIQGYQVIELLINDEFGIYGFYAHFPSGGAAHFIRYPDGSSGANFLIGNDGELKMFVGVIPFEKEWLVNGKRLHELGLKGGYNKLGEWKPIVYPAKADDLIKEAEASSENKDIQGIIFYILTTGHRRIEFVVRTTIDLPYQNGSVDKLVQLWKCPPYDDPFHMNARIYDGWFELDSIDEESIQRALDIISITLNRLAFSFNAKLEWRIKYSFDAKAETLLTPNQDDLKIFNSILADFPKGNDQIFLDSSLDWYNRAKITKNVFASFLCYYVAIENIAVEIIDGKANFGLGFTKETKAKRREEMLDCINTNYQNLFASNPRKFVEDSYFNCIVGLAKRTRQIVELIFGAQHKNVESLFDKNKDEISLNQIRNGIAHGSLSLINKSHEALVAKRLPEIARISQEFLLRLAFSLKAEDRLPNWSGTFTFHQNMTADPRGVRVIIDPNDLRTDDWRIRPEWIS